MEIHVFVIEPNGLRCRLVCESALSAGLRIAGSAASLRSEEVSAARDVDVFLVDADLVASEPGLLAALSHCCPEAGVVLFGVRPDLDVLLAAVRSPLRGVLAFNHLAGEEFARSLRIIAHGGAVIEPLSAQLLLEHLRGADRGPGVLVQTGGALDDLTQREVQVLEQVRRGLSNKEIALKMSISLGTVRAHLRSIFRKLDVSSRAGAAALPLVAPERMRQNTARFSHTA